MHECPAHSIHSYRQTDRQPYKHKDRVREKIFNKWGTTILSKLNKYIFILPENISSKKKENQDFVYVLVRKDARSLYVYIIQKCRLVIDVFFVSDMILCSLIVGILLDPHNYSTLKAFWKQASEQL